MNESALFNTVLKARIPAITADGDHTRQDLLDDGSELGTDASGNPILKDIGTFLKSEIKKAIKVSGRGMSRSESEVGGAVAWAVV